MRVPRRRALWFVVLGAVAVGAPLVAVTSGQANGTIAGRARLLEMDVSGNGSSMYMGEPEIAVNPVNPDELFVDGALFPNPLVFNAKAPAPPCGGWSSEDGGLSWQPALLPLGVCSDGIAVYGPDGTLYAGGDDATSVKLVPCSTPGTINVGGVCVLIQGEDPLLRSTDGGRTWSTPVYTMGSTNLAPFPFAPGSGNPLNTFDRPWIAMDQSTNTLYAIGHNIADHEGFVTASTDDAHTFGPIHAIDSPAYTSGGLFGGAIAAAHGVLAVVYGATKAPGATCPCVIFETSTDHGATFTRHVVPTADASNQPFPFVAADPSQSGHFAVSVFDSTGTLNQVYVTDDSGATWHGPSVVGASGGKQLFKQWLAYGPSGQIALVWRTWHGSPGSAPYDVQLAMGREEGKNGAVFSAPIQVSSAAAPYPPHYINGDDFSFVIVDHKYVRVGWGDSRDATFGGGVQIWVARIPLKHVSPGA